MEPLSSAAVAIASLIAAKASEKTGEKLGEVFIDKVGKLIKVLAKKKLTKTKKIQDASSLANYSEAITELEEASKDDVEIATVIGEIANTVEADPALSEIIRNMAVFVRNEPSLIQNQAKLAEKIGLVVQGGTIHIDNFSF